MSQTTRTIATLYGGGVDHNDKDGSIFRDWDSADQARKKFENELRRLGRGIPRTELRKSSPGWRWNIVKQS